MMAYKNKASSMDIERRGYTQNRLRSFIDDVTMKINDHEQYSKECFQQLRSTVIDTVTSRVGKAACSACGGVGHHVAQGCTTNRIIDKALKGISKDHYNCWAFAVKGYSNLQNDQKRGLTLAITDSVSKSYLKKRVRKAHEQGTKISA